MAALFLAASCQRDPLDGAFDDSKYAVVSFSIAPEARMQTRADDAQKQTSHISDGSQVDMLIYAVYDENGKLLEEFGEGVKDTDKFKDITPGPGQTIVAFDKSPLEVELMVEREKKYKVAFWAQSSKCEAYQTEDLTRVTVLYEELDADEKSTTPNNDELRDAFCRVTTIELQKNPTQNQYVYLYRPLAQINVGTTGYDYKTVINTPDSRYLYSRIQLRTAARYLNVVEDKIDIVNHTEDRAAVDYTYARIPAYLNYGSGRSLPEDLSEPQEDEEFLRVDLDGTGDYLPYTPDEPEGLSSGSFGTETFKYLSMCYVLVPSGTDDNKADIEKEPSDSLYTETTLDVDVYIATDIKGSNEHQIVSLANVPAKRNHRTNIVGNIMTEKLGIAVTVDPIYSGEHNGQYAYPKVDWSGPLAEGVYYDAEGDGVIKISNVKGLLWLQKMVNGKLVYREKGNGTGVKIGDPYADEYFDAAGASHSFSETFGESYWLGEPEDETLKTRTLKALKEEKWPENGNFHFKDVTVRLMADIDLAGIDWLPIGFDCRVDDGSMKSDVDVAKNTIYPALYPDKREATAEKIRIFCGTFDGNGHTIRNLRNVRFSAEILSGAKQTDGSGPYDNPQWFGAGLFGMVGGSAEIRNLRLVNVSLYGFHTGGGIVGTVNGDDVRITDCTVADGSIILSPLHRGDDFVQTDAQYRTRTFARGVYAGGIAGFYNATGTITGCTVEGLELRAYRNIGGLVGSVGNGETQKGEANHKKGPKNTEGISGNTVNNVIIIADKFKPYDHYFSIKGKNAYGWNQDQKALSNDFVGGTEAEKFTNNSGFDIIRTEFSTKAEKSSTERIASIGGVPLEYLPMLSSWFCDNLTLEADFSGKPSAYKKYGVHKFTLEKAWYNSRPSDNDPKATVSGDATIFPFALPAQTDVDFRENSGAAGMYVESVRLDGAYTDPSDPAKSRAYSVLTVEDVTGKDDCAMFITSRDLSPFASLLTTQDTQVSNMLVRGVPFAYTGICLSPNKFTGAITLENVSVYDVYRTLALDESEDMQGTWPDKPDGYGAATLSVSNSNLRGYTVPGAGWASVSYTEVVFERGAAVAPEGEAQDNVHTCKVESPTTFTDCEFKAPFIIEIAEEMKGQVSFSGCKATCGIKRADIAYDSNYTKIIVDATGAVSYE